MKEGLLLNYRVIGKGYPVVFLHGFLENGTMWDGVVQELSGVKTILVDLHGHGDSPLFEKDQLTIIEMAREVAEIVGHEVKGKYSVVGHSLGGYVALELAHSNPHAPEQLILLNSHPFADSERKKIERTQVARIVEEGAVHFIRQAIPNLFRNPQGFTKEVEEYIAQANRMHPKGIADAALAMRDRSDRCDVMKQYANRCLVLHGKHDTLIPCESMKKVCKDYGNTFIVMEEAGHMAHIEATEKVLAELKRQLQL